MGRPYRAELANLGLTYEWALQQPSQAVREAVRTCAPLPLIAIGSGGALSAAQLLCDLKHLFPGPMGQAFTPLRARGLSHSMALSTVWLISAGGSNRDILDAFAQALSCEPKYLVVLCADRTSPLMLRAQSYHWVSSIGIDLPVEKDGFLATNSLLAFSSLLAHAYSKEYSESEALPATLDGLLAGPGSLSDQLAWWRERSAPAWRRSTFVVLFDPDTHVGALDLESKFTEAALGSVLLADYRNFAHGRHHWLAKHGAQTAVIAFISRRYKDLAERTLALLPDIVPVLPVELAHDGIAARVASIAAAIHLTALAGEARGIDPGRPGVPDFGRKLYHLTSAFRRGPVTEVDELARVAIERKTGVTLSELVRCDLMELWRSAHSRFVARLLAARFGSLILDYDGTLVSGDGRFGDPAPEIRVELNRLLQGGTIIAVATGRGKSIKKHLRDSVEQQWWDRVVIGYYNGAITALLSDDDQPVSEALCDSLIPIVHGLRAHGELSRICEQTYRDKQLTLVAWRPEWETRVWDIAQHIVTSHGDRTITVTRSSHSIDILASGVSKLNLVAAVPALFPSAASLPSLVIGDRGRWPGNDAQLLTSPFSLSVDQVSPDPETCWNLAPLGLRGPQATLAYLASLRTPGHGALRFTPRAIRRSPA